MMVERRRQRHPLDGMENNAGVRGARQQAAAERSSLFSERDAPFEDFTPRDKYRKELRIDRDDLDGAVIAQSELYYHVAEAHVMAAARRDAVKLDLEEAQAGADKRIRMEAAKTESKITEAALREAVRLDPLVITLERKLVDARTEADLWNALRDAFQQRSKMLPELVALYLSRLRSTSLTGRPLDALSGRGSTKLLIYVTRGRR